MKGKKMTNEHFTQIAASLNESSTHLQALRAKYDGALSKIEAKQNETLQALDTKKTEAENALDTKKGELEQALSQEVERVKRYILSEGLIIKVGNGEGEKRTVREAYNEALRYTSTLKDKNTQNKVTIEIQEGWEWEEPLGLYDMDLSCIILTQKNFEAPIMVNMANMINDNGLKSFIYMDNAKITINKLHLKAKALQLDNVWFHSMLYTRGSEVKAAELKFDYTQITRIDSSGRAYPLFFDDRSSATVLKFTGLLPNNDAVGEGLECEASRLYMESLTLSGNCGHNGVLINAASSAYIVQIAMSGNCGHNGVVINAASSAYIGQIVMSGNCGHNAILANGGTLQSWWNNSSLSGSCGANFARVAVGCGGTVVLHSSAKNGGNYPKLSNIEENTPTMHGLIRFC